MTSYILECYRECCRAECCVVESRPLFNSIYIYTIHMHNDIHYTYISIYNSNNNTCKYIQIHIEPHFVLPHKQETRTEFLFRVNFIS